ncbi:MAG TPA: catalase [Gemmatimonadales bacterium]|nr:catalase [Gemmatimonadales bacterium]
MSESSAGGRGVANGEKRSQLDAFRVDPEGTTLTTDQGVRLPETDNSLTIGGRGPTLLQDFHFREKITRFDHERIPERVVHARGSAAHGYFESYESLADLTVADLFQRPRERTPVFVRFSPVAGSRGSADTVRDVRGFAVKFYTKHGNWDLVGNNIPIFFIQDAIKFPDLIHATKPEPDSEIPQASTAHDTFWDFVSLMPESMHMIMWVLSDRGIPRSLRMMQGFGIHTFRFVNAEGRGQFVKFHWIPKLGVHSLVWDEAQKLAGKDPDFHRRDLWEAIEAGDFPEWELGVQIVPEEREHDFDFDLLDPTKIIPEDLVPVRTVGRLVLDRNPTNFFDETEQVAFCPANVVPGIDFSDDPLLQGRLFSYLDTQLLRLGGPNFAQIPINRPIAAVSTNHRDGWHQDVVHVGKGGYSPNTLAGGCPHLASGAQGGFVSYAERVDGHKIRARSPSFSDHYSQATLFYNSLSPVEKQHLVEAACFELGKVAHPAIREHVVAQFAEVDHGFAAQVAARLGLIAPPAPSRPNAGRTAPNLSQLDFPAPSVATRRVAVLVGDGVEGSDLERVKAGLAAHGVVVEVVGPQARSVQASDGGSVAVDKALSTVASVMYDAVVVPGGKASVEALSQQGTARHFMAEAFKHGKTVGALGDGIALLAGLDLPRVRLAGDGDPVVVDQGVVTAPSAGSTVARVIEAVKDAVTPAGSDDFVSAFVSVLRKHRHWERAMDLVPA